MTHFSSKGFAMKMLRFSHELLLSSYGQDSGAGTRNLWFRVDVAISGRTNCYFRDYLVERRSNVPETVLIVSALKFYSG